MVDKSLLGLVRGKCTHCRRLIDCALGQLVLCNEYNSHVPTQRGIYPLHVITLEFSNKYPVQTVHKAPPTNCTHDTRINSTQSTLYKLYMTPVQIVHKAPCTNCTQSTLYSANDGDMRSDCTPVVAPQHRRSCEMMRSEQLQRFPSYRHRAQRAATPSHPWPLHTYVRMYHEYLLICRNTFSKNMVD